MTSAPRPGKRRFLILVPNQARDLEGHALIAYHLVRQYGHEVAFSNGPDLREAILRHAPDVLVLDRVDTKVSIARLARAMGIRLAMLPTVGFTSDTVDIETRRAGKLVGGEDLLDCCFTWGTFARQLLLDQTRLSPARVHTVGSPRFDSYSEPYLSLAEPRDAMLARFGVANVGAPLIVWTTNTFHSRTRDLERSVASAVASGVPEGEIRGQLADEGTAFRDLAHATTQLAARHPDWNFVIKLHPSEAEAPYRIIAGEHANVVLATDARIRDILCHCDAVITNTSTTATEAWLLGRTVFEVAFSEYQMPVPNGYADGSYVVTRLEQLDSLMVRHVQPPGASLPEAQQRAREAFIERVYFRIDGRASERCAAALHDLVADAVYTDEMQRQVRTKARQAYANWRRRADRRIPHRVKRLLGISDTVTVRFWSSAFWTQRPRRPTATWDQKITDETVQALFDRFDRAHRRDTERTTCGTFGDANGMGVRGPV